MEKFQIVSDFKPAGDQVQAITDLSEGLAQGQKHQVLLGVTGSGKTFTMANVIAKHGRPTLIMSPNKTLAAQLYAEFKAFFPHNAVEYFISYYDYYQPEAYVPQSDTYIEKDSSINDHIDRLRLKATSSLMERSDVIIVSSVSCIYGLGSPQEYKDMCVSLAVGDKKPRNQLLDELIATRYERNEIEFSRGKFRVRGDTIEIFPAYLDTAVRVQLFGDEIEKIYEIKPLTGDIIGEKEKIYVYPARHFVTRPPSLERAIRDIEQEMDDQVRFFLSKHKLIEAQRIEQRTRYDLELLRQTGVCNGIENYSRPLSGRSPGERPACLIDYFPEDFLLVIDESHVTIPQIGGMYAGDRSRKQTLVDFGFRLPSALDNRPAKFPEFESLVKQAIYVSATPGPYELDKSKGEIVEQVIRPTGLVDPDVIIQPSKGQIQDLIDRIKGRIAKKERVLVTTLTKRTAEDLTEYLSEKEIKVRYMHSDIDALERIDIIQNLRKGTFDVLIGINLLREGLDLPEVSLVAVLDADKEGFLRSETTLIQICGRAARNVGGSVVLYADKITGSMERAMNEMSRRRVKQLAYNKEHNVSPKTIIKAIKDLEEFQYDARSKNLSTLLGREESDLKDPSKMPSILKDLDKQMRAAAEVLDFETAAVIRDKINEISQMRATSAGRGARTKK